MKHLSWLALVLVLIAAPAGAEERTGDVFYVMLSDGDTGESYWVAPYERTSGPRTGWTDGDRQAYRCAYMFLLHRGRVVGRVTFTRAAGYAAVNDKYMESAARNFEGVVNTDPTIRQFDDCPAPSIAYEPYDGPDERPVIEYVLRGTVLETRDYRATVAGAGVTFRLVDSTRERATVVAYKDGLPVVVVYYDSMSSGVVMEARLS